MNRSLEIRSEIDNLCEVESFCKRIFRELKFSRKTYCRIYLATMEAVNNAIIHGNKENPEKKVKINFVENDLSYQIKITDEGNGFNIDTIPDPTKKENLKLESGRGIFIMKQYSDEIRFQSKGRIVNLLFKKS